MEAIRIIPFTPTLQPYFEAINKAWINEHFTLEPVDIAVLENPQENLLDKGGAVIFAVLEEEIVGTVALKEHAAGVYEMTKMGVVPAAQGKKVGWALAMAILEVARGMGGRKVVLYSSRKLIPAINMYRKMGFREVVPEAGKYARCDIKMEIDL
ncbi:GNAT family N-acetyltransferase [Echinicola vietnamensis]|uniref:Acetyltransferase n=1 Tax=Echinicola vietnamensis (strain DSM 17526 / LMG 23754 / KMM 6221) TaxID=926556 RepID=L0FZD4_ECHVK|nr:GNAT family N-acetyltransferase [Echinicola vietnamensis]AGA78657.1 acetyltransferase [Echinicola vietnamensis DSM 17526]